MSELLTISTEDGEIKASELSSEETARWMEGRRAMLDQIVEIAHKRLVHPDTQSVDSLTFWYMDLLLELGAKKESEHVYHLYRLGRR